jgi:hypothetical protein
LFGASGPIFPRPLIFPIPVSLSVDCLLEDDVRPARCTASQPPEQQQPQTDQQNGTAGGNNRSGASQ